MSMPAAQTDLTASINIVFDVTVPINIVPTFFAKHFFSDEKNYL